MGCGKPEAMRGSVKSGKGEATITTVVSRLFHASVNAGLSHTIPQYPTLSLMTIAGVGKALADRTNA
jgi:hypothetical protein